MTQGDAGGAGEESKAEENPNKPPAEEEENVDPYEFFPDADILSKFDSDWCDATAAIK